jgi:CRP-like cAMP-binding protein
VSYDLKRFPLLVEFSAEDCEALSELLEEKALKRGRRLFGEGNEADGLVLVQSGTVVLKSGRAKQDLGRLGPGSTLGALSLVTVGARECTARAETDCELLLLARTAFRRLVDDAPRTACRLLEAVTAEVATLVRPGLDAYSQLPE